MRSSIRLLAWAGLLAVAGTAAPAVPPTGTQVYANGYAQGGSNASFTWLNPGPLIYKVWVQIPAQGTASNAPYRVYPKGNPSGGTACTPDDPLTPCFEVPINQAARQKRWVQLTLNKDPETAWRFTKAGFVSVDASTVSPGETLGAAAAVFQDASPLAIGKTYQGGIIFYLNAAKSHGLIAAPTDQGTDSTWWNGAYLPVAAGPDNTAIGMGQANTEAIVAAQGAGGYAARLCYDLVIGKYTDWYLPSKDELNLMYTNIGPGAAAPLTNVGGFASALYWSSSGYQYDDRYAWGQGFGANGQSPTPKSYPFRVRAVRSF